MARRELDAPAPPPAVAGGRDSWHELAQFTAARIALGRAGGSCRTRTLLELRSAHASARDAVLAPFDAAALEAQLAAAAIPSLRLASAAAGRQSFLLRPDLGRRLSASSRQQLLEQRAHWGERTLAAIVSDGLSAQAAERHALPTLAALLPRLAAAGWSVYPVLIVPLARVKLQDEIGELLGARHALMLLGERPGLGSPDSLGAYFTFAPCAQRSDADRNCISNIRPDGLPPAQAAHKLAELLCESARRGCSGIALKDGAGAALPPGR